MRFVALMTGLAMVGTSAAADWPRFLGPEANGHSAEKSLLRKWPGEGPKKVWERNVGSGYAGPAVANGRLVLFHRVGDDEVVECLDAASGAVKWTYKAATGYVDDFNFDDGPRCTPVIHGSHVFTLGADGRLTCLEFLTGKKTWDRELATDYPFRKGFFGVGSGPLVDDERVVINVGSKGVGIVALDRATGKELWRATNDEASYSTPTSARISGKRRYVFFTRAGLQVLEPGDGSVVHQMPFRARINASVNAAAPLIADDHIFLSTCYGVGAILLKAGDWTTIWKSDDSLSSHYNTAVLVGDHLYGSHGRQEEGAALRCVEWKSGKVAWSKADFGCAWLIAADGLLIAVRESGEITLIEAVSEDYRELSSFTGFEKRAERGKWLRAAPALSDGVLFARDAGKLVAWRVSK